MDFFALPARLEDSDRFDFVLKTLNFRGTSISVPVQFQFQFFTLNLENSDKTKNGSTVTISVPPEFIGSEAFPWARAKVFNDNKTSVRALNFMRHPLPSVCAQSCDVSLGSG